MAPKSCCTMLSVHKQGRMQQFPKKKIRTYLSKLLVENVKSIYYLLLSVINPILTLSIVAIMINMFEQNFLFKYIETTWIVLEMVTTNKCWELLKMLETHSVKNSKYFRRHQNPVCYLIRHKYWYYHHQSSSKKVWIRRERYICGVLFQ